MAILDSDVILPQATRNAATRSGQATRQTPAGGVRARIFCMVAAGDFTDPLSVLTITLTIDSVDQGSASMTGGTADPKHPGLNLVPSLEVHLDGQSHTFAGSVTNSKRETFGVGYEIYDN